MTYQIETPLSEDEVIELDNFLISNNDDEECLTVDEAHGFITGLIVSHALVLESDWMQTIWGDPAFADDTEKERMTSLLHRMHHEIVETLKSRRRYEPMVAEYEEDDEIIVGYEGWCFGFMLAVSQLHEQWEHVEKKQQELLAPIATLALLLEDDAPEIDDEEYELLVDLIPGSVTSLYQFWENQLSKKD